MKDEENVFGVDETTSKKPRIVAFIVVFLLLLVALGFAINYFLSNKAEKKVAVVPTATIAPTEIPTDTPSATPSAAITGKLTPSPTSTTKLTPTSSANTAETGVTVEVLNGSGTPGVASKMSDSLKSFGYTVNGTGNASTFDYTHVVIQVKKSEAKILTQLQKDLGKDYTIGSTSATLADTNATDAIVIVGK